jgi:MFS family permease
VKQINRASVLNTKVGTEEEVPLPRVASDARLEWRGLTLLGLVAVPTFIGYAFFTNVIQLVVTRVPNISGSAFDAGLVIASFWLSTAIFQTVLSPKGAPRARFWIALALFANFILFAVMTRLYTVPELVLAAFFEGACFSAISPLSLSLLMVDIPRRYVGRAMGIYGAAEDVGVILGPVLGTAIWVEFGLSYSYLAIGVAFLLVLVPFVFSFRD